MNKDQEKYAPMPDDNDLTEEMINDNGEQRQLNSFLTKDCLPLYQ
ncbi:hypothetical protein [Peribacillus aracenensis]|nr:hypothetical protein [Peribacillus sp. BBB004]